MTEESKRSIIRLNVGGTHYEVSRNTIERCEGSMLASLISETWKEGNSDNLPIFIDRNGRLFEFVLDYLRTNKVHLPPSVSKAAVKEEFEFYGIAADMSQVHEKYGFTYLRDLNKRINAMKAEANAIEVSVMIEQKCFTKKLPFSFRIHEDSLPFDTDTLRICLYQRGLLFTVKTSDLVYVEEITTTTTTK